MTPTKPTDYLRTVSGPALVVILAGSLALAGCGEGDAPDTGEAPAQTIPADAGPGSDEQPRQANTQVNAFRFEAEGAALAGEAPQASQLTLAGGCRAPNHLSLGFLRGNLTGDDYFYFSMNASAPIEPGMTGVIEPVDLIWDNGVIVPDNLPPGVDVKVPVRLEGTGRLAITSHSGIGMGGRMVATAEGEVTGDAGTARITVSFDMNFACGL
ncbi:MAG: hypothetical protein ACSLE2_06965 [Lysobacterales bacterium]